MSFLQTCLAQFPVTCVLLTLVAVSSLFGVYNKKVFYRFILHPYSIARRKEYDRLFTSDFFHNDVLHLIVNEALLYVFGSDLEEFLKKISPHGSRQFLLIYLSGMLISTIGVSLRHYEDFDYSSCGASGGIMGCMFSFMLLAPNNESLYLPFIGDIKNIYSGLLYILVMMIYRKRSHNQMINLELHFFGALGGIIATLVLYPIRFTL